MTPASSASSTSQQMEKYKNARNKSPVGPAAAATTDSSGKLRRYEGYEKDLHKILNKASAKRTTAPLQPVKTNSRAQSTSPAPTTTAEGKSKRRNAGEDD